MSSSLDDPSSEMVMVDEQIVACEVEIDGFDVDFDDNQVVEVEEEEEEDESQEQYVNDPSVANEYYEYEEVDGDPETVYLYDEDTSQIHQLPHHHHRYAPTDEHEIDVEYVEQPGQQQSTSSSSTQSTSSGASGGVSATSACVPGTSSSSAAPTYFIRKTVAPGKPIYSPVTFNTTYSEGPSGRRLHKRVIKRTHMAMGPDDLDAMVEDTQVLKKLQTEINSLRKDNEQMKKEYEAAHRRLETVGMVLTEAKTKNRQVHEEKKQLLRDLAVARAANSKLVKEMCPDEPQFGY